MATGAIGTNNFTAANLAELIPELWGGDKINDFYRSKLTAANHFWDVSELAAAGGDTINIPSLSEMSANDKDNNEKVTLNSTTYGSTVLSIDTHKEVSFLIEKKQAKQVLDSYQLQEKMMSNAGYTVARTLDTALLSLYAGLSTSEGASDAALSDSNILSAIETVRSADVPSEDLAFFFNSAQIWGDLMGIDRYVNFDYTTDGAVDSGVKGALYGIKVYETNNLVTTSSGTVAHGLLAHKDAFVFATQAMDLDANYMPDYMGVLVTADALFGVKENRDDAAVHIISSIA
jgi:hypothetical protein